ncbi:hypothetical protein KC336_g23286, partial [Hortaea werneckii]
EGTADEYERKQKKRDLRQGIRARDRGKDFRGEGADIVITGNERSRAKKLKPWQSCLRKGEYKQSLDLVLTPSSSKGHNGGADDGGVSKDDILTCLTALHHRSALRTALANRPSHALLPLLHFLLKQINSPRFVGLGTLVLGTLLDLYAPKFAKWQDGSSGDEEDEDVDEESAREVLRLLGRVQRRVRSAADLAGQAVATVGVLDLLAAG